MSEVQDATQAPWVIVLTAGEAETLWYLLDNAWNELNEIAESEPDWDAELLARERAVILRTVAQLPEQPWGLAPPWPLEPEDTRAVERLLEELGDG